MAGILTGGGNDGAEGSCSEEQTLGFSAWSGGKHPPGPRDKWNSPRTL